MNIYSRIAGKINKLSILFLILIFNIWKKCTGSISLRSNLKNITPSQDFESVYANSKREIEIQPSDMNLREVIFSCYFIYKADPQFGMIRSNPDIEYIAPWYRSIEKTGTTGIILHDGLDPDFISKHQTDKILFRKYTPGLYSIFEERWFAYYIFLWKSNITKAFFTDINDVYITRSPFPFVKNDTTLYVGRDNANKVKDSGWMLDELKGFEADSNTKASFLYKYQYAYNAGVIGGGRNVLLFLMSRIIDQTLLTRTGTHKDMTILNLCIFNYFTQRIDTNLLSSKLATKEDDKLASNKYLVTGYPFNSEFKKYDLTSDAYFIHK